MKGLNIKKLAAVGIGAALLGSAVAPIATAAFEGLTKDQLYSSAGSPTVNIVVGTTAAISDAVWAGNISARVASLAFTETPVETSAGTGGGALTPKVEDVTVDLTVGGVTTIMSGATDDIRFVLDSNIGTEFDDQKDPSNSDGKNGQVRETDADLDFLRDETVTKRVGNVSSDLTAQELIDILADAKYNPDPDVEDLQFIVDTQGVKYRVNLGAGLSAYEADGTNYLDNSAEDKQELFFFGKLYQIRKIQRDPTNSAMAGVAVATGQTRTDSFVELFEESQEKLYSEGDELTGLVGKGKYEGQEMKVVVGKGFSRTTESGSATNVIHLDLYDSEGNFVDGDEFAPADDETLFTDELNDNVLESGLFVQQVNKRTDTGFVETFTARILTGSSRVELRESRGFPFDEDNTSGIYDWDITLLFAGDTDCNSQAAAQGSGCTAVAASAATIDQNKLIEIQIFNDNLTFNSDDSYLRATGRAGGAFGALNPNNGFESVSMKTGEGEVFFTIEFGGFEFETMNTLKLGRGANDDTGYVEYQDEANRYHKVPMEVKNLVTTTASGAGRVFTFDNGAQDYYYEFRTDDQNIEVGDDNKFNGMDLNVNVFVAGGVTRADFNTTNAGKRASNCSITSAAAAGNTGLFTDTVDNCVIDGMAYRVTGVKGVQNSAANSAYGMAYLTAKGMLKMVQGTTVTQTSRPAPFDTSLNNAIYLDDGNVFEATGIQLQGNGGTLFYYYPAMVDNSNLKTGFLLLAGFNGTSSAVYPTEDGGQWTMIGTSIPAVAGTEDTAVDTTQGVPTDRNYFAPDNRNFSGGPGFSQAPRGATQIITDQTDSDFLTAIFRVDQGEDSTAGSDYDFNAYVDTKDGRLVDAGNDQLSAPKVQATHMNNIGGKIWDLRFDQPETYQSRAYSDFGSKAETDGSVFTLTYPENTTEGVVYVFGEGKVEVKETGGTTQSLGEGQSYTDSAGTKVTVSKVNVTATCEGAAVAAACVASPSVALTAGAVKLPMVYLDSDAPVGKNVIVGGPIVNTLAAEVAGLADRLAAAGDVVAEVDATTGDVVLAGYTADDTGRAAQQFIDALDALS